MRKPAEQFRRPFVLTDVRCVKKIYENRNPIPAGQQKLTETGPG